MNQVCAIYDSIDRAAPFKNALSSDNTGMLVGDREQAVTKALLCLDITAETIGEAVALGAELMIAHHPVIFDPLKAVPADSPVYGLIRAGIAAVCCHTNLDLSPDWGVNRALANILEIGPLERLGEEPLFLGDLPEPMAALELADFLRQRLGGPVACTPGVNGPVKRVALCSGAGGEFIYGLKGNAQALITGEARHDEWIEARRVGIPLLAAGHYETEKPFAPLLRTYLAKAHPQVEFYLSNQETTPAVSR